MEELVRLMGRFVTPTIVIGDEVLLGFGPSLGRIQQLIASTDEKRSEETP